VLDQTNLGDILGARILPLPGGLVRAGAAATWRLRIQPSPEGWVDMGRGVPLMSTERARRELGWEPRRSAGDALRELLSGMASGSGGSTPPLDPEAGGTMRIREVLSGIGARN
jgi:hypothetical protein